MTAGAVTTVDRALGERGDWSATTLASPVLAQQVWTLPPGARSARAIEGRSEVAFVSSGRGLLRIAGEEQELRRESAAFFAVDDWVELEAGDDGLQLVLVRTPGSELRPPGVPLVAGAEGSEAEDAGIGREFRLLVGPDHGCRSVTQFVGYVPPGRAKMHNHPYDELAYIVEGQGALHWHEGESVPVARGSCIYFPRLVFHSLENTGDSTLRIMGVFHPAGSPADRVEVLDY
jgi:mannose-6-phosphate isomerase-like protein (cupin superfamily)